MKFVATCFIACLSLCISTTSASFESNLLTKSPSIDSSSIQTRSISPSHESDLIEISMEVFMAMVQKWLSIRRETSVYFIEANEA